MKTFKTLATESLANFKERLGIKSLDVYRSKIGKKYVVVDSKALMFSEDFDGEKPVVVLTMETTDDTTGELTTFQFIGNERREVVGTL